MKKKVGSCFILLVSFILLLGIKPGNVAAESQPVISYCTHVQNVGWQNIVTDGEMSGTEGLSYRLEGIKIEVAGGDYDLGVTYQTHIQNIGWEADTDRGWKSDGEMSGTEGLSYRLEAIQIELTGADADLFDVCYQVHAQNVGWMGWAKNGERSGTAGYSYRLEGIRIVIVPKGEAPPTETIDQEKTFIEKSAIESRPDISYCTHVQNVGWQNIVSDGEISGTEGLSYRLEGIKIEVAGGDYDLGVTYQTHIQNIGWEADTDRGWKSDGEMSGTEGLSYRLEAIQIELIGADADLFDICYQVHTQNVGWMGWAKNGERSGTAGYSYRLEGIRIVIVPKGEAPPTVFINQEKTFIQKISISDNLMLHSEAKDFNNNVLGLDRVKIIDDGIILESNSNVGVYTAEEIATKPFNKMVMSWNCTTPSTSSIQVEARVFVNNAWSEWLSWGAWGNNIDRASGMGTTDGSLANVDVDTLVVKNGQTASKMQYRVILNSPQAGITPVVSLVAAALRNTISGQEIEKVYPDNLDFLNLPTLDVPQFSQMVQNPAIADSICSPTSISMVLNYYGTAIEPETAAWGIYDYDFEDFGNWSFNTAYAGSMGYESYVDYSTIEGLKREIAAGHPIIASVAYKNSSNVYGSLPVVDGAPYSITYGHLIVVCGFTIENGTEYVIINDPAASNNSGVRVKYRLDQFFAAWAESGNISYIIH